MIPSRRIQVFLKVQNPAEELTNHSASKSLALLILAAYAARPINVNGQLLAIQLNTAETWKECKLRIRGAAIKPVRMIPITQDSGYAHPWSWQP